VSDEREIHKLGEVLRTAREARGVDLARVERDTKIRSRYLSALERGEYRELPGAVYTKGFLRNYGAYLGLDPEYLIDLFRLESAAPAVERPVVGPPPRPIAARKRALVVTPGAVVAALLTVGIGIFIVYFVNEFVTFAGTPELRITDPAGDLAAYQGDSYTIRGVTEPNSRITVDGLRENPTATADPDGNFAIPISLVPGPNVITLMANDPLTGRDTAEMRRTINVVGPEASPTPGAVALTVDAPQDAATVGSTFEVRGTATAGQRVEVSGTRVGRAQPTFEITTSSGARVPSPSPAPGAVDPVTAAADAEGAWRIRMTLPPGDWELTATSPDGSGEPVTRRVRVRQEGVSGTLRVVGNASYVEVDQDGAPKRGASGVIARAGTTIRLAADHELRILAGSAGAVRLMINGLELGAMGDPGDVVEWTITRR
jgi:cytoskeletal protein RodZ